MRRVRDGVEESQRVNREPSDLSHVIIEALLADAEASKAFIRQAVGAIAVRGIDQVVRRSLQPRAHGWQERTTTCDYRGFWRDCGDGDPQAENGTRP